MKNYLLDKGVIRRLIESFSRISVDLALTSEQLQVSIAFKYIVSHHKVFLTVETYNILRTKFYQLPVFDVLNTLTEVIIPVRYTRRWARRLRYLGFSREDAWQVAMATFCTDKIINGKLIKIDNFLTLDRHLHDR